jgi:hypothetical protein
MVALLNSRFSGGITLLITFFSLSLSAYTKYSGGTGEPNDPYKIDTTGEDNATKQITHQPSPGAWFARPRQGFINNTANRQIK